MSKLEMLNELRRVYAIKVYEPVPESTYKRRVKNPVWSTYRALHVSARQLEQEVPARFVFKSQQEGESKKGFVILVNDTTLSLIFDDEDLEFMETSACKGCALIDVDPDYVLAFIYRNLEVSI